MRRLPILLVVLSLVAACAAISTQKSQAPKPDNLQFKNLQVLSPNITHDELVATMRTYARSLGTRCDHCHLETMVNGKEQTDFASDAKPEKNVARTMMRMTRAINGDYVSHVNAHGQSVTCATCHRGHTVPEQWTPPPPQPRPENPQPAPAPAPAP